MPTNRRIQDEKELVRRARDGDLAAFERLLDHYQERVMRIVMSILKNPMDAEEVTQDVFMTVFTKVDQFREEASLSTWIHRISINAALMRKRREKTRMNLPFEEAAPGFSAGDWQVVEECGPAQVDDPVVRAEARTAIQEAVGRLDEKYQTVFLLRDVQGLSTAETAAVLRIGIPAIKTRLHRARRFLRQELASYFGRPLPEQSPSLWSPSAVETACLSGTG